MNNTFLKYIRTMKYSVLIKLFIFLSVGISQSYPPVVEMWTRTT